MWWILAIVWVMLTLMAWSARAAGAREHRMNAAPPMPEWTIRDQFESECG